MPGGGRGGQGDPSGPCLCTGLLVAETLGFRLRELVDAACKNFRCPMLLSFENPLPSAGVIP